MERSKEKKRSLFPRWNIRSNGMNNSVSPGEYESIHATALGKVMISEMSEEEIYKLFEDKEELPAYTPHTILTVSELIHEAEKVKKQGYGVNDEEYWIGMYCMAVPVRNYTGRSWQQSVQVFRYFVWMIRRRNLCWMNLIGLLGRYLRSLGIGDR